MQKLIVKWTGKKKAYYIEYQTYSADDAMELIGIHLLVWAPHT